MTIIIGLLGGKGVGKSTAATHLHKFYDANLYAIADNLKEMLRIGFGLTEEQFNGTQAQKEEVDPRYNLSPRQMMQRQGDAMRKTFGNDFLIKCVLDRIHKERTYLLNNRLAVISDVRYKHEAEHIRQSATKQHPAFLWRLHPAPGLRSWQEDAHQSETEWQLPRADLELTPGLGEEELHYCLDRAYEISVCFNQMTSRSPM